MTKKKKHLVLVLDETGSMFSKKEDTIGGFNQFLKEQKAIRKYEILFSMTLFNSVKIEKRYVDVAIKDAKELDEKSYIPSACTPLWDAVGQTIQENTKRKDVLFIIITDGQENASREFKASDVKTLIREKEKDGWGFMYLGVGLDDFQDGSDMGIALSLSVSSDMKNVFRASSSTTYPYYESGKLDYSDKD